MRTLPSMLFFFAALFAGNIQAQTTYGLSGSTLITFDASAPGSVMASSTVTGIMAGQTIEGLDCRPATGELYALGYNSTTGEARLYVINPATATATAMGMAAINLGANLGN
ncbi:MAG: DUF4394 domain-containing protein, partial [Saprospiraceae bacterium]|nr:DUF4394 domain-containing protein [Saprospiraceae bacterium]